MFNELPEEKLTTEQEQALAKKIQAGNKIEENANQLAMSAMREAVVYARHVTRGLLQDDELISVCYTALLMNAKRFRPGMIRFFSFAKPGVRGAFQRNWTKKDTVKHATTISREELPYAHENPPLTEEQIEENAKCNPVPDSETVQPDFDGVFTRERWDFVSGIIEGKLNTQEKMILNLAFRCGLNFAEIGRMLGVSRAAVQGVSSRALKKVRCELLRRKRLFND